jgi:DNA repair protein RadC
VLPVYLREAKLTYRTVLRHPHTKFQLTTVRCSEDAYRLLGPLLRDLVTESLVVLALTARHAALGYHEVARGSVNLAGCAPADVFRFPLLAGAAGIILAHNHPSGNEMPSSEDLVFTESLARFGAALGIEVIDHLVIGSSYFSMLDHGVVRFKWPGGA